MGPQGGGVSSGWVAFGGGGGGGGGGGAPAGPVGGTGVGGRAFTVPVTSNALYVKLFERGKEPPDEFGVGGSPYARLVEATLRDVFFGDTLDLDGLRWIHTNPHSEFTAADMTAALHDLSVLHTEARSFRRPGDALQTLERARMIEQVTPRTTRTYRKAASALWSIVDAMCSVALGERTAAERQAIADAKASLEAIVKG